MALYQSLTGEPGPSIPYEIFLNIVEELIAEALSVNDPKVWWLAYHFNVSSKLIIADNWPDVDSDNSPMRRRFRTIRLASQINHQTQSMVHRRFTRHPMTTESGALTIDAWVRPDIDFFIPYLADGDGPKILEEMHFRNTIHLPTPQGAALLQNITQLWIPSPIFFMPENAGASAAAATLPNLNSVHLVVGRFTIPVEGIDDDFVLHSGIRPLDPLDFPDLASWALRFGGSWKVTWRQFKKRGISLYGHLANKKRPLVELYPKRRGLDAQFVWRACSCCEKD